MYPINLIKQISDAICENFQGVINITDSRPEHVRAMLQFIYTGTVDNSIIPTIKLLNSIKAKTFYSCAGQFCGRNFGDIRQIRDYDVKRAL